MGIKDDILSRVDAKAGGNSKRGLKEVASDLLNSLDMKDSHLADLTLLSPSTIARVRELTPAESGEEYRPMSDTLERIFRGCGAEISMGRPEMTATAIKEYKEKL